MTQIATCPLSALYFLKLSGQQVGKTLTIHLVGAELEFEVDVLQKWEYFFLHLIPRINTLNIVFVGPELNKTGLPLEIFSKLK